MRKATGRRWMMGIALALVACAGLGAVGRAAASGAMPKGPPAAPVIATVDLEDVIKGLKERGDKEAALQAKQEELKAKVKALEEEVKNDQSKLNAEPDPQAKIAMSKAIREKVFRAEFEAQYASKVLAEMQGDMLRELYMKISAAVQAMAKKEGYSLVMTSDENVPVNPGDPDSVRRAIAFKRILYAENSLDITAAVITYLNNQYAAGGGAASPASTPAPAPTTKPTAPKKP